MDSASDLDEEGGDLSVTASNFEAMSRALDTRLARDAELDVEELQLAAQVEADDLEGAEDMDVDEDEIDAPDSGTLLLTPEERAEEKRAGGPEVHVVQKRMRQCLGILKRWKISGAKMGRLVPDLVVAKIGSTQTGIAPSLSSSSYQISPAIMATTTFSQKSYSNFSPPQRFIQRSRQCACTDHVTRLSSSSMQTRFLVPSPSGRILSAPDVVT